MITIRDHPQIREKTVKIIGEIKDESKNKMLNSNALIYIKKDERSSQLTYGDCILIYAQLKEIEDPKNPYSFDYKMFMKRKKVYFTGYVGQDNWKRIPIKQPYSLKKSSHKIQTYFSQMFLSAGLSGEEYSIATAILLGNDDTLEPELKSAYAAAGVSHILCVSGMHVGIIFMILNYLLYPLSFSNRLMWIKSVILFLSIWFYANITGLSPSVMRSATMFSFVLIGNHLRRNTNIFHSLFASLFILLFVNPLLIFDLGFQLSYLAVAGIVIFQKPIYSIIQVKSKIFNYFWNLAAVSLAAQLATFPITIYYFGVFPNYFLLANLSVIFLSFVVLITSVCVLVGSFSSFLSLWIGKLLTYEIKIMNIIIRSIEKLPYSITDNISINRLQIILLYASIIMIFLFFVRKNKRCAIGGLFCLLLFMSLLTYDKIQCKNEISVTVYSITNNTAIGFNYHGNSILIGDSTIQKTGKNYQFSIKNHERKQRMNSILISPNENYERESFCKCRNFIKFYDTVFYIHTGKEKIYKTSKRIKVDYLLVTHNAKQSLSQLQSFLDCGFVIIDESNSDYYTNRWQEECKSLNIPYYSLKGEGKCFQKNIEVKE